jgi:hypothetical protein
MGLAVASARSACMLRAVVARAGLSVALGAPPGAWLTQPVQQQPVRQQQVQQLWLGPAAPPPPTHIAPARSDAACWLPATHHRRCVSSSPAPPSSSAVVDQMLAYVSRDLQVRVCRRALASVSVSVSVSVCSCVGPHTRTRPPPPTHTHAHKHSHTHTRPQTQPHTHTHIHTHTHTQPERAITPRNKHRAAARPPWTCCARGWRCSPTQQLAATAGGAHSCVVARAREHGVLQLPQPPPAPVC